jgi:hypothetical protein
MIRVVHPGSGSLLFTHPGSRIQGSKRHRIPDPDPQHCIILLSVRLNVLLSSRLSLYISPLCLSLQVHLFLSACLYRYISSSLPVSPSTSLPFYLSLLVHLFLSACLSLYISSSLPVPLCPSLPLCLSLHYITYPLPVSSFTRLSMFSLCLFFFFRFRVPFPPVSFSSVSLSVPSLCSLVQYIRMLAGPVTAWTR